jgi:hypothetical protein
MVSFRPVYIPRSAEAGRVSLCRTDERLRPGGEGGRFTYRANQKHAYVRGENELNEHAVRSMPPPQPGHDPHPRTDVLNRDLPDRIRLAPARSRCHLNLLRCQRPGLSMLRRNAAAPCRTGQFLPFGFPHGYQP